MSAPRPYKKQPPRGTYYLQDRYNKVALARLTNLERMITIGLGGVLPAQPDPTVFRRVLDIGCGSGSWVIDAAQAYPTMSLVGIDIDKRMIDYARGEAEAFHVNDRVEFQAMDALLQLEFPDTSFDLVNLRLGASFIRTWDWPNLLREMLRVTRPKGVLQITELEIINQSSSPALLQVGKMLARAFFLSGHFFEQEATGITAHLAHLLQVHGCQHIQTKASTSESRAGTPGGQALYEDMVHSFQAMRPFIQKWGCDDAGKYDLLCQQALDDMQQSGAHSTWNFLTVWGKRP